MADTDKQVSGRKAKHEDDDELAVSGIAQDGPDNAVAVKVSDLRALVEHARQTGADELADRFAL